ncbi:MAG: Dimethylmenaquinone methyltransferase [Actinomycetia bacterium]|nr:Dimethylmenaquinone methyltransferase [Actinomycetes bacterium]
MPETDDRRDEILQLGAATLGETGGRAMQARMRAAWPGATVAGPVFTVRCSPADNLAIHVAAATAPSGSVLVVQIDGEPERGYWGEVLTTAAESRGVLGLVIDGGVRDSAALEAHGFPVFSTMLALRGADKNQVGSVNEAITVGDVTVEPGDWVVGDGDGVVVIPGGSLDAVLAEGRARADKEEAWFTKLRAGTTTVELLDLDVSPIRRG